MLLMAGLLAIFSTHPSIFNKVKGQGHVTTPGYFDVKVSDGERALFDVKLDDLSKKHSVPSPHHGLMGGHGQLEL